MKALRSLVVLWMCSSLLVLAIAEGARAGGLPGNAPDTSLRDPGPLASCDDDCDCDCDCGVPIDGECTDEPSCIGNPGEDCSDCKCIYSVRGHVTTDP